ncbi:hypothetical protein BJ165DRAFT_577177 [Panaeolus papilionaceus]|nr:hypothetical protein BJ165DRAFT_577177 [Panaeolus papilionaceus]
MHWQCEEEGGENNERYVSIVGPFLFVVLLLLFSIRFFIVLLHYCSAPHLCVLNPTPYSSQHEATLGVLKPCVYYRTFMWDVVTLHSATWPRGVPFMVQLLIYPPSLSHASNYLSRPYPLPLSFCYPLMMSCLSLLPLHLFPLVECGRSDPVLGDRWSGRDGFVARYTISSLFSSCSR